MKIKSFCWILFAASVILNFFLFSGIREEKEIEYFLNEEQPIYPENSSSFDDHISFEPEYPAYSGFTLEGDETEFLDFRLNGTIVNSIKDKYGRKTSRKLVRNIQEISYFLNNFNVRFSLGDRISLIYRKKDSKIAFLRFSSANKRSVHEVFLFAGSRDERYVTSSYEYLQPCITNGPFSGCPNATFVTDGKNLVPVFNAGFAEKIRLPFLAKLINTSESFSKGGEMTFVYSNFAVKAVFKGLSSVNTSLRKNALYNKGVSVGESGFVVNNSQKGVIYYLKKGENRVVSPFSFHHVESIPVDEKEKINVKITISFFKGQYNAGKEFEEDYY